MCVGEGIVLHLQKFLNQFLDLFSLPGGYVDEFDSGSVVLPDVPHYASEAQ